VSYTAAITEMRQLLADTEFHKRATKKKLIGKIDANNQTFFTYDKRLLEDSLEVYVNDEAVSFTLEDAIKGQLLLGDAPAKNTSVVASYYYQFWIDDEVKNFLNKGAEQVSQWTEATIDNAYLSIPGGLKSPALMFAASMATDSLISYMINRRHSEEFNIEQDGNDDNGFSSMITAMKDQAKHYWDRGVQMRDDFYKRQGKRSAPAFAIKLGKTRQYGPMR
jgi:hypothetical protein